MLTFVALIKGVKQVGLNYFLSHSGAKSQISFLRAPYPQSWTHAWDGVNLCGDSTNPVVSFFSEATLSLTAKA